MNDYSTCTFAAVNFTTSELELLRRLTTFEMNVETTFKWLLCSIATNTDFLRSIVSLKHNRNINLKDMMIMIVHQSRRPQHSATILRRKSVDYSVWLHL